MLLNILNVPDIIRTYVLLDMLDVLVIVCVT